MSDVTYYIAPFLSNRSMHLITGAKFAGKTTYALQMLMPAVVEPEQNPWGGFNRADEIPDVWYVDLTKSDGTTREHVQRLGLHTEPRLHVLTYNQVLEIRPEQNRKDPITFFDILSRIAVENGNQLPPILIVDGFALLFMAPTRNVNQVNFELERLQEINRAYLQHGGCLIGVQALSKNGRIPGDFELGQGTYLLSSFAASVTEIRSAKDNKRRVSIAGQCAPTSLMLEFDAAGRLQTSKPRTDDLGQPVTKTSIPGQLQQIAIALSLEDRERKFRVKDLIERATQQLGVTRRTVNRWLLDCRLNGTVQMFDDRGVYQLVPPPEPPVLQ